MRKMELEELKKLLKERKAGERLTLRDLEFDGALDQIREKNYGDALEEYQGKILLVGINYDKKTKKHECGIEVLNKI